MSETYNLIIDTDVGSDDCLAIAMALEAKNAKVHAITTVFGNVSAEQSATNVATLISLYDQRDIPFYVGCLTPIASSELAEQWAGHGPNGMGGYSFENEIRAMVLAREHANQPDLSSVPLAELLPKAQTEHAVAALLRMVHARPHFYDLIALGPLTNLAMACKLDPSFLSLCRSVTWMGGSATGCGNATLAAEFNAFADAEAAKVVFDSAPDGVLRVVPWEVCHDNAFSWREYDEMTAGALVPAQGSTCASGCGDLSQGATGTVCPTELCVRAEDCNTFKYLMKRVTKHYEICMRGHVVTPDTPNPCIDLDTADSSPYAPADAYAMAALLQPHMVTETLKRHCAVETQGALTRGFVAVDWYGVKKGAARMLMVRRMDGEKFRDMIRALAQGTYQWTE